MWPSNAPSGPTGPSNVTVRPHGIEKVVPVMVRVAVFGPVQPFGHVTGPL
jgi:hypothetical protein